jgi:hypothetical protein
MIVLLSVSEGAGLRGAIPPFEEKDDSRPCVSDACIFMWSSFISYLKSSFTTIIVMVGEPSNPRSTCERYCLWLASDDGLHMFKRRPRSPTVGRSDGLPKRKLNPAQTRTAFLLIPRCSCGKSSAMRE